MIYLDVTSASQSVLNTGVKRMQRGLHGYLKTSEHYTPVCWQSARRGYRTLKHTDLAKLEQTSRDEVKGLGVYDIFSPGLISDWFNFFVDGSHMLRWPQNLTAEDLVLIPDLLWDNRGAYWSRFGNTPAKCVGIFHDAIALRRPEQSAIDRYLCARGVRALAHLDAVICISQEAESDLHFYWNEFGLKPVPTKVILWPVPFSGEAPALAPNFSAKRILYVARLEPHKNHLHLLDACEKLWNEGLSFELRLIGCLAYPGAARKILRRIRSLQEAGRAIQWQAHVSEAELRNAYQECSFTAFPSLLEGFGLPIIESLWYGRPVVCGTNGALGEVARDGGYEPVETESVESLADGLRLLLIDKIRYYHLCNEIRQRAFRSWQDYWKDVSDWLGVSL
jgi:glycosyltransferase involved in cell wall biosynthesis